MAKKHGFVPFQRWIFQFRSEDSDRGKLARWFTGYSSSYSVSSKFEYIKKLKNIGSSEFLIETFGSIWHEFENISNVKISIPVLFGSSREYRKIRAR